MGYEIPIFPFHMRNPLFLGTQFCFVLFLLYGQVFSFTFHIYSQILG